MIRPAANSPEERLKAAEIRIRELELDLQAAHTQLNQIRTNFFYRIFYWLFSAPADLRRQKMAKLAERILRKTHLDAPAAPLGRFVRPIVGRFFRDSVALEDDKMPRSYDIVCLPAVVGNSRFERSGQLMAQLADRGHRVFYASLHANRGRQVRLGRSLYGDGHAAERIVELMLRHAWQSAEPTVHLEPRPMLREAA